MDDDIHEIIYCAEDNEYRIYCKFCDKIAIDRFLKNEPKLQTHTNKNHKKLQSS